LKSANLIAQTNPLVFSGFFLQGVSVPFGFLPDVSGIFSGIGPLNDPATWYGINYTGMQVTQWDFQNKGTRTSPARHSFALKFASQCNLFANGVIYQCNLFVNGSCKARIIRFSEIQHFPVFVEILYTICPRFYIFGIVDSMEMPLALSSITVYLGQPFLSNNAAQAYYRQATSFTLRVLQEHAVTIAFY